MSIRLNGRLVQRFILSLINAIAGIFWIIIALVVAIIATIFLTAYLVLMGFRDKWDDMWTPPECPRCGAEEAVVTEYCQVGEYQTYKCSKCGES